ncbi:MAG: AMP-binding protein [Candidatus Neomarinimicrobiota bacterium]|nr:AMP-binding protein [Candidatus Neomarinimicrobiota bacterium]
MTASLADQIYQAQCIGNVEPIEYMVPYPSTQSLIEGQNIKFSDQVIYEKENITNLQFYELVQQTAHWLVELGIQPKERVIVQQLEFPQSEILLFGIWHLGAVGVLIENEKNISTDKIIKISKKIPAKINLISEIKSFPISFDPQYKPLLSDEALVFIDKNNSIRLSHYNLLVNTNSIQKALDLKARTKLFCNLQPVSTAWVVFKAMLPIYAGCLYTESNPDIIFSFSGVGQKNGFQLRNDWENLEEFENHHFGICPENTAAICLGKSPVHLTHYEKGESELKIQGHSVMMGYLNDKTNEIGFRDGALYLKL